MKYPDIEYRTTAEIDDPLFIPLRNQIVVNTETGRISTGDSTTPGGIRHALLSEIPVVPVEQVATPTFSPSSGTFTGSVEVTISCATAGATIHYTTNGTAPTTSSPVYSAPFTLLATTTVRALAVKSGMSNSDVAVKTYTAASVVYYGSSVSSTLNEAGITGLAGTANKTTPAGSYVIPAPGSPEKFMFLAWPDGFTAQPRVTDGFMTGGIPMTGDLAGAGEGYNQTQNGWPYMLVTVGGVSYRVYRTLYTQALEATITVNT